MSKWMSSDKCIAVLKCLNAKNYCEYSQICKLVSVTVFIICLLRPLVTVQKSSFDLNSNFYFKSKKNDSICQIIFSCLETNLHNCTHVQSQKWWLLSISKCKNKNCNSSINMDVHGWYINKMKFVVWIGNLRLSSLMLCFFTVIMQQHFFDDEDRMVPSTPTLVVPHRTDGFAEAIQ